MAVAVAALWASKIPDMFWSTTHLIGLTIYGLPISKHTGVTNQTTIKDLIDMDM